MHRSRPPSPIVYALLEVEDDKERLAGMDPQLRRSRTLDAVVRLLLSEASRRPLILVVEDLHWLDDESQSSSRPPRGADDQ